MDIKRCAGLNVLLEKFVVDVSFVLEAKTICCGFYGGVCLVTLPKELVYVNPGLPVGRP